MVKLGEFIKFDLGVADEHTQRIHGAGIFTYIDP